MAESTTDVWVTDWLPSGNRSLSFSEPLWCCRRFPTVPDFRRPDKHSHNYKIRVHLYPQLPDFLFFPRHLTGSHRYPHLSAHCSPEQPSFLPGMEKAVYPQPAAYRGMGPGRRAPILLGPTGVGLPGSTELPGLHHGWFSARQEPESAKTGAVILFLPGSGWWGDGGAEDHEHPRIWAGGHLLKIWNSCAKKTNKPHCSSTFFSIVSHGRIDIKYQSDYCNSGWVYCKGNYWRFFLFLWAWYSLHWEKNPTVLFCRVIFLKFVLFELF